MTAPAPSHALRPVHAAALAHIARRLRSAAQPPWLHGEVARRMSDRLALIRLQPTALIDWWSFNGASAQLLRRAYPKASLACVEDDVSDPKGTHKTAPEPWWSPRRWSSTRPAITTAQDVAAGGAGLLWANMMLHLVEDPAALLTQWQRALAIDGFLMFSTLGPGSLQGLRTVYARMGWAAPHAPFVDMHDLGDMLVRAGFADPVMDQEIVTLTWADAEHLLDELRTLGGNAEAQRFAGLRTPRWRARLCTALQELQGADGRLRLDFEVVYGHAFKAAPKPRVAARTTVALDEMRAMVQQPRRGAIPRIGLR